MPDKDPEKRREYKRAYNLAHREEMKAQRLAYYQVHREEILAQQSVYRVSHREQIKVAKRAYHEAHRDERNARSQSYYRAHREQHNARNRAYRQSHPGHEKPGQVEYRKALKAEALHFLGDKCACPGCGVAEPAFLQIDHINGHPNRRSSPILEAKASGWDKTKFQILCANCNCAKKDRGFCTVHQSDPEHRNGHRPDALTGQTSLWAW